MEKRIQVDTKEKLEKKPHITEVFDQLGVKLLRSGLYVGDWTLQYNQRVVIDTKANILEIAMNTIGSQAERERLKKEIIKAQRAGIMLIFLIEERPHHNDLDLWQCPVRDRGDKIGEPYIKNATGSKLRKTLETLMNYYGCYFVFCDKDQTAIKIVELLNYYNEQFIKGEIEKRRKKNDK